MSGKYTWKCFDHAEQPATDALKTTSKRIIQKNSRIGNLIGIKIANGIMKVSKTTPWNSIEIVKNENDKEIPKERYISRRKAENDWWSEINIIVQ